MSKLIRLLETSNMTGVVSMTDGRFVDVDSTKVEVVACDSPEAGKIFLLSGGKILPLTVPDGKAVYIQIK